MAVTKTSWPKGRSGNPHGRPRLGEELSALLRQTVDRRRLAEKLCELCYAGDVQAMRLLLAYTDGLPLTRAEVDSPEAIQITVNYVQQNNRFVLTSAPPSATEDPSRTPPLQRRLLRSSVRQDRPGDGSADPGGAGG